jgi:hypothetical protein
MTCPFCTSNAHDGPFIRGGIQYDCGTFVWDDEIDRSNQSPKCINAEVGRLKARIARLEEALDALTVVIGSTRVSGDLGALQNAMDQALVVLGNKEAKP